MLPVRIANLGLGKLLSMQAVSDRIETFRYAEMVVREEQFVALYPRWWPRLASQWDSWRDGYLRSIPANECRVFFSFPWRSPDYMTINYVHSGPTTQYRTLKTSMRCVEEIAIARHSKAILCQAYNERLTQALMKRWGFEKHAVNLGDNNYIKRLTGDVRISRNGLKDSGQC